MTTDAKAAPAEVLCIGFGALGTIYSYLLSQGGAQVTAVARSNYSTLSSDGIHISSAKYGEVPGWKPHRVIREVEPEKAADTSYDFVLCTFKNVPDLKPASSIIRPFLKKVAPGSGGKLPTIVLLQNGVGIEEEVQRNLVECEEPLAKGVVSVIAWIGANLVDGGTKVTHGALERLEMGVYASSKAEVAENGIRIPSAEEQAELDRFASIYAAGGGTGKVVDDIESIRWQKVLWNASWGGLSTLSRQPVNALLQEETLHYSAGVVRRIMLEIMYVARSCGIGESRFPAAAIDQAFNITLNTTTIPGVAEPGKGGALAPNFKPSILLDLEYNRPMEMEPIIGNIVAFARKNNVDTPRLDLILAALKPNQLAAIAAANARELKSNPSANSTPSTNSDISKKYSDLNATSKGNWPEGAPVSKSPHTYL
ncbi:6-phosphogluconate dehydrogenase C-terminal domain-like protein [Testicularia cyperi]|uniref:6-phosphogluconate dehydrogenase C-terminal domain-like protein n=1 Tax=Testicularia cyperi TaxID=1882483 RepID=A0A317XXB5_9BASI|nr:6-phosphogluconate dehydrogenase C-terminal domain-like protein [Testicularia cyperi]